MQLKSYPQRNTKRKGHGLPIPRFLRSKRPKGDVLLDTNSDKCPPLYQLAETYGIDDSLPDQLIIASIAERSGFPELGFKLRHCGTDAIIWQGPDGKFGRSLLRCNHKLCPECHRIHSKKIRERLRHVIENGHLFITLTISTKRDSELRENIIILRRALRSLTQRKREDQWCPFETGFFWRLEITPGKGFHPHLHLIVDSDFIDYYSLRKRWSSAVAGAGGFGDFIHLKHTNDRSIFEIGKYLSKELSYFDPHRWRWMHEGLFKVHTHGSGGSLKLPKPEKKGCTKICFASQITDFTDYEILKFVKETELWNDLTPSCDIPKRLKSISKSVF